MFAADTGSVDPKYPVSTGIGKLLKSLGGTVIASYGYGISPSSARSAEGTAESFVHAGGKTGVLDTSVPFGSVAFASAALYAKQKKVDAIYAGMDNNSNFALATALKQAGVKTKAVVFPTGFLPAVVNSPAWKDLQGDYFDSEFRPVQVPNAATKQLTSALQKYEGRSPAQFPDFNIYESWLGADLMIKGLELAGRQPDPGERHQGSPERQVLQRQRPAPVEHRLLHHLRSRPAPALWVVHEGRSKGFVPTSTQPLCGHDLPGTSTASTS